MASSPELKLEDGDVEEAFDGAKAGLDSAEESGTPDVDGEASEDGKDTEGNDAEKSTEDPLADMKKQLQDMQDILLEQKRENAKLNSRLKRLSRPAPVKKEEASDDDDEDEKTTKKEEKPDVVQALEDDLKALHDKRDDIIETQYEVLLESKSYSDIKEVCSKRHIADVSDALTNHIVEKDGIDYHHASLEVEKFLWSQKNPYKYLYGLIKEYHPIYAGKGEDQDKSTSSAKAKEGKKDSKAPDSIAKVPGSKGDSGGWTSARIDAMSELELSKVPKDIYEKYLANELE